MSDSLSTNTDALGASKAHRPALMGTRHMAVAAITPRRTRRS